MDIKELAKKYKQYVIDMRREFHMYPESSWHEVNTSRRIKEELDKMDIPYISVAGTGIAATIKGGKPGKTVALRADIDALEVQEANDIEYKSKNDGMMHACGHDGHGAMLLGAGKILNDIKDEIEGTVKLFFQPAEEITEGAEQMIKEGVMEGVDGVFAIHLWADIEYGRVSVEAGPRMAASDIFKIKVSGKGGHGSMPHQGVDAIVAASAIVMDIQSIVSREISPLDPAVVSIGMFNSGTRFNVISNEAVLEGTTRCFNKDVRDKFPGIIERVVKNTAKSYRAKAEVEYTYGTFPTINNEYCSKIAEKSVEKILNREAITLFEKITGAEDFSYFLEKAPGVLAFVGIRNEAKQACYPHHNANFQMDEEALEIGTALYAQYAVDFLTA
jgi:amidohydrolase